LKVTSVTIGLPVASTAAALNWYQRLFGPTPQINPAPGVSEMEINPGAWLQFMDPSGEEIPAHVLRVGVKNLTEEFERLERMGIAFEPMLTFALPAHGVLKLAYVDDPDGNRLCLYEVIPDASRRRDNADPSPLR